MTEDNGLRRKGLLVRLRFATDDRLVASVRRGDPIAFEALYERHVSELLSFCVYMLGSRQDAEDAVQATFASAYRALRADRRRIALRPWLFTIARNESLSILRSRRPTVELNGEPALGGDPLRELEVREEVRHVMEDLSKLPESQRAALVLAEVHGLSQVQIGTALGVRPDQVKAYIFQARSNLLSERRARETDCEQIREELANARGAALLRGRLRRHLRSCQDCRVYADGVARQRRQLGALLPLAPSLVLKSRAFRYVLESGAAVDPAPYAGGAAVTAGSVVGAAVELAGGGAKAVGLKMATGVACLCASVGVGASVLGTHEAAGQREATAAATMPGQLAPLAAIASAQALGESPLVEVLPVHGESSRDRAQGAGEPGGSADALTSVAAEPLTSGVTVTVMHGRGVSSQPGATNHEQTQSPQERQEKHEEKQQQSEQARQKREEAGQQREEHAQEREEHKQERVHEQEARVNEREAQKQNKADRAGDREEKKGQLEQGEHERTEEEEVGFSKPPPSEEQLRHQREQHEERQRVRESHTEEELQRMREERLRRREERRKAHEAAQ